METEIKIDDKAVMMRILEAGDDSSKCDENSDRPCENSEDELSSNCENTGLVRVLTDSENGDEKRPQVMMPTTTSNDNRIAPPKRVTFGGEEIKLRTPDSDSVIQSDNDDLAKKILITNFENHESAVVPLDDHKIEPKTKASEDSPRSAEMSPRLLTVVRQSSASPIKRSRRASYSSIDEPIVSPKVAHKGIEVLHNLQQRSPSISPNRSRRNSANDTEAQPRNDKEISNSFEEKKPNPFAAESNDEKTNWESLGLVSLKCIQNSKSGVSQIATRTIRQNLADSFVCTEFETNEKRLIVG